MDPATAAAQTSIFGLSFTASAVILTLIVFTRGQAYFWAGWVLGPRLFRSRLGRRLGTERIERAHRLVARHATWMILIAYLNGALRFVILAAAGSTRFSVPRQLAASVVGATLWGLGMAAGLWALVWSWARVAATSPVTAWLTAAAAAVMVALWTVRRHRRRRARERASEGSDRRSMVDG